MILRNPVTGATQATKPALEYGSTAWLPLDSGAGMSFIQFGLPADLRKGATVLTAKLRVYQVGAWSGSRTLTLQKNAARWRVSTLNWNNKGSGTGTTVPVTQTNGAVAAMWEFNVAADVQAWVDGTLGNAGWRLTTSDTTLRYVRGAKASSLKPTLELTYTYAPVAPTSLHPSAGSVSVASPTLRWSSDTPAAIQVHVDPAASASPAFDSGTVATTLEEFALAGSAYAGLTAGSTTQWRVRIQNAAGLWSAYSQWATFTRTSKPTLTITQPTATVTEASPPVAFTMTGLAAYQVLIAKAATPSVYIYDSKKISGTTGAHSPANVMTANGTSYIVTVRAWDSVVREATPGDPGYMEATVTTTLAYSGTVTGVTSLTAVQVAMAPWVDLTFVRATQPDGWAIVRDGEVIYIEDVANNLFFSGTTYKWRDWTAAPNRQHTYFVYPVIGGVTSNLGSSAVVTPSIVGIWVGDPETITDVQLLGRDEVAATYGEDATTFNPIGATAAVSILTAQRGLEGQAIGLLTDALGRVGTTQIATLLDFKGRADNVYRLAWADVNIPVVLRNINPTPTRQGTSPGKVTRSVALDFFQSGELPFTSVL